mmetsp:Transcript_34998/g.40927  ORF Transcript_34998/g.40927 Transcript_34998/m.40927 type:complete len:214 (+) Transcript_34998:23-664(+)
MMITAAKAVREGLYTNIHRLPLMAEPIRKHFYDETLEHHPHDSLQLLLNDPTLFNKLSTQKLTDTPDVVKPKRSGLSELSDKRYNNKIENTWYNPQHFVHVLMYDKFTEDVESFNINDLKTTESFSITSEGKVVDKCSTVPDVSPNGTQANSNDISSMGALRASMIFESEVVKMKPTTEQIKTYYENVKAKKEARKKRGWRKYVTFESVGCGY